MVKTQIDFPAQMDMEAKISDWAHDLRSPFNQVLGFTKLMMKGQSGPLTNMQEEDLNTVYTNSLRTLSLINNLIEIARLQRGEKDIKPSSLDLQATLDQIIALWQKNHPELEMPIAVFLTTQSPTAELDKKPFEWVLTGFFSYLAAYSEGTGSLALEVGEEKDTLVFTLRQTGITKKGFDEISLEMFAFICKAYIDLQGGEIRQSELDDTEAMVQFILPK
jgi:signal transduction histidine kinase